MPNPNMELQKLRNGWLFSRKIICILIQEIPFTGRWANSLTGEIRHKMMPFGIPQEFRIPPAACPVLSAAPRPTIVRLIKKA